MQGFQLCNIIDVCIILNAVKTLTEYPSKSLRGILHYVQDGSLYIT